MRSGSYELRFDVAIDAGATAGERDDVTGIVGPGIPDSASICAAKRLHILRGTHTNHVLARPRTATVPAPELGVAIREDDDHFLIADRRHRRVRRLRVAHQDTSSASRYYRLHSRSPPQTIRGNPRAIAVGARFRRFL